MARAQWWFTFTCSGNMTRPSMFVLGLHIFQHNARGTASVTTIFSGMRNGSVGSNLHLVGPENKTCAAQCPVQFVPNQLFLLIYWWLPSDILKELANKLVSNAKRKEITWHSDKKIRVDENSFHLKMAQISTRQHCCNYTRSTSYAALKRRETK